MPIYLPIERQKVHKWDTHLIIDIEHIQNEHGNAYILNLTDLNNPLFYYSCFVSPSEFSKIQKEQDLVVDFENFPAEVHQILKKCTRSEEEHAEFVCKFSISKHVVLPKGMQINAESQHVDEESGLRRFIPKEASLKVYQRCSYRNIPLLTLNFMELDDFTIKQKLLQDLEKADKENQRLHTIIEEKGTCTCI